MIKINTTRFECMQNAYLAKYDEPEYNQLNLLHTKADEMNDKKHSDVYASLVG